MATADHSWGTYSRPLNLPAYTDSHFKALSLRPGPSRNRAELIAQYGGKAEYEVAMQGAKRERRQRRSAEATLMSRIFLQAEQLSVEDFKAECVALLDNLRAMPNGKPKSLEQLNIELAQFAERWFRCGQSRPSASAPAEPTVDAEPEAAQIEIIPPGPRAQMLDHSHIPPAPSYQSLYSGSGNDQPGTVAQNAFPNPVSAASGLYDKLSASQAAAMRPGYTSPAPRPFLLPPTAPQPAPLNTPPSTPPQLPQAAAPQYRPLNQPAPQFPGVKPLPGYGQSATPGVSATPQAASPAGTTPAPTDGPMKLLPYQNQLQTDQAELQRKQSTGSGVSQIKNPFWRTLARVGDVAASVINPNIAAAIPGTTYHHDVLMGKDAQRIQGDRGNIEDATRAQQAAAQSQQEAATVAGTLASTQLTQAQAVRAGIKPVPTVKYSVAGLPESADDGQGHVYTPNSTNLPPDIKQLFDQATQNYETNNNKTIKPLTADHATSMNQTWNPILQKHHLPLNQFTEGMSSADSAQLASSFNSVINQGRGDQKISITLGNQEAKNAPLDTSDPDMQEAVKGVANGSMKLQDVYGRGATMKQKAQFVAAVKQVNPDFNSGDNAIENASRKYFTSGQGGSTLNAGQTLTHHLDLYDKAVDAVHNGDSKILNAIANEFGVQLGSNTQTNLALIRQGVAMEAARFYTGGIPGEAEINRFNNSLSGDGSPAQMHGGATTVRQMAAGKMKSLQDQANAGANGQANFAPSSNGAPAAGASHSLATAMALPFNKGKSAAQVTADLKSRGYSVVP